jgi:chemotaxis response regulator CheB
VIADGVSASVVKSERQLPVIEVTQRARLEPNTIFVIPPERFATIDGGELVTVPTDGAALGAPVDRRPAPR